MSKILPSNNEAERAVLGAFILEPTKIFGLDLDLSDFQSTRNRNIYQAILALATDNKQPSYIAVLEYYRQHFGNQNGIASYISSLTDDFTSIDLDHDAALIREVARQRRLQIFLQRTLKEEWKSADRVLEKIQAEILSHQVSGKKRSGIKHVAFRLSDQININKKTGRVGQQTGFRFLDRSIEGFIKSYFWTIGAYTSHGKTALMVQLVVNLLEQNKPTKLAIFSTEMNAEGILLRLLANRTGVPSMKILRGDSIPEIQERIDGAFDYFHTKNVSIHDDLYTFEKIFLRCKQLKMTGGLDVVFVDFLQNMQGKGTIYERMSVLPVQLQKMAKDLNICVVAMSQVSNEAARSDSRVIGYKGAGEIAAASDLGLWLERDPEDKEALFCAIRKNRHGPTGKKNCDLLTIFLNR